ncbi:MAG: hypothetical protein AAB974_00020 [Patescibacteria group bacterium]
MMPLGTQQERGFVSVLVVLVMLGAVVAVGLALSNASISGMQHGYYSQRSEVATDAAEGCTEEAFIRLKRNNSFLTTSLTVGSSTCSIVIGGTNPNRTFTVSSTVDTFMPRFDGTLTVSGRNVTLTNWDPYAGF